MKKAHFLSALLWLLLALAACGKADEEPHYYEIRVESGQLEELERGQFLLGQQYYQGEPVNLVAEPSAAEGAGSTIDVYVRPMGGEKQLLLSGVSKEYRTRGWYLDEKGNCFILGSTGITRLDGDGKLLYHSRTEDIIHDICCLEDGRIILLTNKDGLWQFSELDPDTGKTAQLDKASKRGGAAYIGAWGKNLMLLDAEGFWRVDLKKGKMELELPFAGTLYFINRNGESPADFRGSGSEADILWSSGNVERLERADITGKKEIITVRGECPDWLKRQMDLFNQSSDSYYAVLEEPGAEASDSDFLTETSLRLASGKGPDIICSNAVPSDVSGLIEKGIFADLAPLMKASGLREEDYFPAAFDVWRDGDQIYGIVPNMAVHSYTLDKAVLNGREELTIETLVDSMLEFEENRCFSEGSDGVSILTYFLEGSQNLWGMVDWEKGTCDFSGELFSKMLRAAKRYAADKKHQYPAIREYRSCFDLYHFDIARKLETSNRVDMGTFFDDGHYAESPLTRSIAMGIHADSEHIEGAWQLLAFLLSEEPQSIINYYYNSIFPVNKSVFDRLAQEELEYGETIETEINGEIHTFFKPGRFGESVTEEAVAEMRQMLSEAKTLPYKVKPLLAIISEETSYYFDGAKSMEEVVTLVQNRVQLYLDEHKTGR